MMQNSHNKGFTLIELMIVIVILGVITAIAYPLYTNWVLQARRAEAHKGLTELANRLQRDYINRIPPSYTTTMSVVGMSATTEGNHYVLQITGVTTASYSLRATAIASSPQNNDTGCTIMTLSSTGLKTPANCWKK